MRGCGDNVSQGAALLCVSLPGVAVPQQDGS